MRVIHHLAYAAALCLSPAALPAQSPAAQWRPIHRDSTAQFFVDHSTLQRRGSSFTIQARAVFHEPQDGVASLETHMLYDCAARTLVILHLTQLRADGSIALDGDTEESDRTPDPIATESANDAVLNEFCQR